MMSKLRLAALFLILGIMLSMALFFKPGLFLSDKYAWYTYIGNKYYDIGNQRPIDKAIEYADKAVMLNKTRTEAHDLKARIYNSQYKFEKAEKELSMLIESGNVNYMTYWRMGKIKYNQGKPDEALEYFEKGIKNYPSVPHNYLGAGFVHYQYGNIELAEEYLKKCIKWVDKTEIMFEPSLDKQIEPAVTHKLLSMIYEDKGENQKAKREKETADTLYPKSEPESIFILY